MMLKLCKQVQVRLTLVLPGLVVIVRVSTMVVDRIRIRVQIRVRFKVRARVSVSDRVSVRVSVRVRVRVSVRVRVRVRPERFCPGPPSSRRIAEAYKTWAFEA